MTKTPIPIKTALLTLLLIVGGVHAEADLDYLFTGQRALQGGPWASGAVTVTLSPDKMVITVSGNGDMGDYQGGDESPWSSACDSVTGLIIEGGVTSVGARAFSYCHGLASVNVSEDNPVFSSIDGVLFNKAKDTLIWYPRKRGGAYTVPQGVKHIGRGAFGGVMTAAHPAGWEYLGEGMSSYSAGPASVTIGDGVTSIGDYAFAYCAGLKSVTLPDGLKHIGSGAFIYCLGLTSVRIPGSVKVIGANAFWSCRSLISIKLNSWYPPKIDESTFSGVIACLYVPKHSIGTYRARRYWSGFQSMEDIALYNESAARAAPYLTEHEAESMAEYMEAARRDAKSVWWYALNFLFAAAVVAALILTLRKYGDRFVRPPVKR